MLVRSCVPWEEGEITWFGHKYFYKSSLYNEFFVQLSIIRSEADSTVAGDVGGVMIDELQLKYGNKISIYAMERLDELYLNMQEYWDKAHFEEWSETKHVWLSYYNMLRDKFFPFYEPEPKAPPRCHADCDGDCEWEGCPQLKNYKTYCPYAKHWEDYTESQGYDVRR